MFIVGTWWGEKKLNIIADYCKRGLFLFWAFFFVTYGGPGVWTISGIVWDLVACGWTGKKKWIQTRETNG